MRCARLVCVVFLSVCSTLAAWAQAPVNAGRDSDPTNPWNYSISYEWRGRDVVTQPVFESGRGWVLRSVEEDWPVTSPPPAKFISVVSGAPESFTYSIASKGTVKAMIDWIGVGLAPESFFVRIEGRAYAAHHDLVLGSGTASNGLGDKSETTDLEPAPWSRLYEAHGLRLARPSMTNGHAELVFRVSASVQGDSIVGASMGDLNVGISTIITIASRSASLVADLDPTSRREIGPSGRGVPVINERDRAGNMFGDTVVELATHPVNGRVFGDFSFEILRGLSGAWNYGATTLFNEWWCDYPEITRADTWLSEIESLNVSFYFLEPVPPGEDCRSLSSLKAAPLKDQIFYQVTDQVDSVKAKALYEMSLHLPLEKTNQTWEGAYTGHLDRAPHIGAAFTPTVLYAYENQTPYTVLVTVTVQSSSSYSFGGSIVNEYGAQVGPEALRVQFGEATTLSTTIAFAFGSQIAVEVEVPPMTAIYFEAIPNGTVNYPLMSSWGSRGFDRDVDCSLVVPGNPAFILGMRARPL